MPIRRPPPSAALAVLTLALASACSLSLDVDGCPNDEACGPRRSCVQARCVVRIDPGDGGPDGAPGDAEPDASGGQCDGAAPRPSDEVCNGRDDDCDGEVDEDWPRACYGGPEGTAGVGICVAGTETCSGGPAVCAGELRPRPAPGLLGRYALGDGASGLRVDGALAFPDRAAFALPFEPRRPFDVVWTGILRLPAGVYTFRGESSGLQTLTIGERAIFAGEPSGAVALDGEAVPLRYEVRRLDDGARVRLTFTRDADPDGTPGTLVGAGNTDTPEACDGLDTDCDGLDDEAAFAADANVFHCGGCGVACLNPAGTSACVGGACVPRCGSAGRDGDGDPRNGCEAVVLEGDVCGVVRLGPGRPVEIQDVTVCAFDEADPDSGSLEIEADEIRVLGALNAAGRGYGGGGGGGGGGGLTTCEQPCIGEPRPVPGGVGGSGLAGGAPGGEGEPGLEALCEPAAAGGAGGDGGRGGGPAGGGGSPGARARDLEDRRAISAAPGEPGGYDAPGSNQDQSQTDDVLRGSGGGGGGGSGGVRADRCCGVYGGAGGGAGNPGGGRVVLRARRTLVVEPTGSIFTYGLDAARGNGGAGLDETGDGGPGGSASAPGNSFGGRGAGPEGACDLQSAEGLGGNGGPGGGGGVLLSAPDVVFGGRIDARGGRGGVINGGTVKVFHCGDAPPLVAEQVEAAVVRVLRHPGCR